MIDFVRPSIESRNQYEFFFFWISIVEMSLMDNESINHYNIVQLDAGRKNTAV